MESRERFGEFERVREKISAAVAADRPTAEHRTIDQHVADEGSPATPGPADAPE